MTTTTAGIGTRKLGEWAVASLCDDLFMPTGIDHLDPQFWLVYADHLDDSADPRASDCRMVARLLPLDVWPSKVGWWDRAGSSHDNLRPRFSFGDDTIEELIGFGMRDSSPLGNLRALDAALREQER